MSSLCTKNTPSEMMSVSLFQDSLKEVKKGREAIANLL